MNIFKTLFRFYKGKKALKILKKAEVLPANSRKLYTDIKRAGLKGKL